MAYLSKRKHNESTYLYACEDYTDPVTKKRGKTQKYLGKIISNIRHFSDEAVNWSELFIGTDFEEQYWRWRKYQAAQTSPNTDELISLNQILNCIDKNAGIDLLCNSQAKRLELTDLLSQVFGSELSCRILTLVFFCARGKREPLYSASIWSKDEILPAEDLTENDIAKTLADISPSQILQFQSMWLKKFPREDNLSLDITSVSSYSREIADVMWGYNRDRENLPQINLLMMISMSSKLPVWHEILPGAISDISTVEDTFKLLHNLGDSPRNIVFDRGFASAHNFAILHKYKCKYTCGIPYHNFQELLQEAKELYNSGEFLKPENILSDYEFNNAPISCVTLIRSIGGHRVYDHMFYTDYFVTKDLNEITRRVKRVHDKLKKELPITDPVDEIIASTCFVVKKTPKRGLTIKSLPEKIQDLMEVSSGFFTIRTNVFKDPKEALRYSSLRDGVEKRFDDLKNQEDMKRLRIHTSHNMRSRIFIQFLAQILRCDALNQLENSKEHDTRLKTVNDIYMAIESLRLVKVDSHRAFYKYPTKMQQSVIRMFSIPTDNSKWSKNCKRELTDCDTTI